jgi:nucleoside-diphosphate-sugar epimerase
VFFDNVYSYGLVRGTMTEETPFNPTSRKGEVRARINTTLLDTMRRGEITALIARAPDFYGPGAVNSFTHLMIFERVRAGKTPQWLGNARVRHDFIFTPDAGRAVAMLGRRLDAFGTTWHLPVVAEGITGEQLAHLACRVRGLPPRVTTVPRWLLRALGLFVAELRANDEMMYQFEAPYHFSSARIEAALGLTATPYADGVEACLR